MCEPGKEEETDSDDEFNMEALEEAVDNQFFKSSFFCNNQKVPKNQDEDSEVNNLISKSYTEDESLKNELTESCKTFIAKKLNERLDKDILLKSSKISSENKGCSKNTKGIRLFNSSTAILRKDSNIKLKKSVKRKHLTDWCNEEAHMLKCKQVAINTEQVLSQCDTYYWTNRKPQKQYLYSKLANGTLSKIK